VVLAFSNPFNTRISYESFYRQDHKINGAVYQNVSAIY